MSQFESQSKDYSATGERAISNTQRVNHVLDGELLPSRGVAEYLAILRQRIWWVIISVTVVLVNTILYTTQKTPLFQSTATVHVLKSRNTSTQFEDVVNLDIASMEDFNTQVKLLESTAIINKVSERLKGDLRQQFFSPYEDTFTFTGPLTVEEVLLRNRKIVPVRQTLIIAIHYIHPDATVATRVANYFAEEYINYNINLQIDGSMAAMNELKRRADQQLTIVNRLEKELNEFKNRHKSVSFEDSTDIDRQELLRLNEMVTLDKRELDQSRIEWEMVESFRQAGKPLWDLDFVAAIPNVSHLLSQRSTHIINVASLSRRYKYRHPKMVEATQSLQETENELKKAVDSASEKIRNRFQRARENYENALERVTNKKNEIILLGDMGVEYEALSRELHLNEQMYDYLYSRMQQAGAKASEENQIARIVDPAVQPNRPFSPKLFYNIAAGFFGGIILGFSLVFASAVMDDRIKSMYDIEVILGMNLLGIISRIRGKSHREKARIVVTAQDARLSESFHSLYTSINLTTDGKSPKVILVTSTTPSEGKSFIAGNLALTSVRNGEKTILIDADLRIPSVDFAFQGFDKLNSSGKQSGGIIQYVEKGEGIENLIQKDIEHNLDILTSGGRSRHPNRILRNKKFIQLIDTLRLRYDRIILDTPPLAPVSDTYNLVSICDGILYVTRFNTVKKKAAAHQIGKLREAKAPILGIVLNDVTPRIAGCYYSHYYDESYESYYNEARIEY